MKIALLLRGFHFLERDRFGCPLDARLLASSLLEQVIQPLRRDHEVTVFAVTYDSPILPQVAALLHPDELSVIESDASTQISTFLHGLQQIASSSRGPFDRVVVTRFDLVYLKPISDWAIWSARGVFFPWREYEHFWKEHQRVGDAIHVVDAPTLPAFVTALESLAGGADLHGLYQRLEGFGVARHFIEGGFHDSNTMFANRECENSLYRIGNRPRIAFYRPVASPWMRRLKQKLPPWLWKRFTALATRILSFRT